MESGSVQQRPAWPAALRILLVGVSTVSLLLLMACNRPAAPTEVITLAPVMTPDVVEKQLSPATSLDAAATQLANALGVSPEAVRVRIRPRGCITCSAEEHQAASSLAGLGIGEASSQLQADDDLWLFVQRFTCMYHFDGISFIPQGCQSAPV